MTERKSTRNTQRVNLASQEDTAELTQKVDICEKPSITMLVKHSVRVISNIADADKKKGIYAICDEVCRAITEGVDEYERNRIKLKRQRKLADEF
jgi:hypothetical protein